MAARSGAGARKKGADANRDVVGYLKDAGLHWLGVRQAGEDGDDVIGLRHFSIEVKNQVAMKLAAWQKQSLTQAMPGQVPLVWHKKKGSIHPKDWYVTLRGEDALRIIKYIEGVDHHFNKEKQHDHHDQPGRQDDAGLPGDPGEEAQGR